MALSAGDKLGSYEILAPLGAGGMGEVWKARDVRLGRIVAIKRLHGQHSERFEQETRAIAALNHPNICQIYDVGPDYLVLEFVDGKPPQGPLPVEESVRLALQISGALAEAHRRGIIHRDLKPGNILVTEGGSAKLLDFGLAKFADASASEVTKTAEGTVMGTAAYMSPEQASGKALDERSDVFSFGAVLFELLSGRRAFGGASSAEVLSAVLRDEPERLAAPSVLAQIVTRCLRKMPAERFQTMEEVHAALKSCSGQLAEAQPSIAVLPFANMSRDPDDEYFSDGLAEEIINALTQIPGLKVIARTSAFAFKGKNEDIRKIAETLGVTNVLEGSVRRAGSRLRVTAQLIHAADGTHLWSQRFDREMTDVFAVQDEIAAAISGALQVTLVGRPGPARPHQPNLPAYEAFLRGRHQLSELSPEAFTRAEEYFRQAIALDPRWAEPHSALAHGCFFLGFLGLRPLGEMIPLARTEAWKALDLLPSESVAHAVLGAIAASYDYDWKEAEEQFRLARIAESPPAMHDLYAAAYLLALGRFEEANEEHAKAIAQDPLNPVWSARRLPALLLAGLYERTISEARKVLEFDQRNFLAQVMLALVCIFQGKITEAREPAEEALREAPWNSSVVGALGGLLARAGETERAEKLIAGMRGAIPVGMVIYHLVREEIDPALDWYERAIEQRQPLAAQFASGNGPFRALRASPRWPKLAKMMNLPASASSEKSG